MTKLHHGGVRQFCLTLKRCFTALFLTVFLAAGIPFTLKGETPLFKNGNFAEKSSRGLPLFWRVRAKDVSNIQIFETDKGNAVRMCPQAGEMMFLIQYPQFQQRGVRYKVTYEVRSAKNTPHRVYLEWRDEFGKLKCNDGSWSMTTDQWQEQSFIFLLPEKSTGGYLVLSPEAGGEVEFRNIRFELTDDTNLLKNPNFFFRGSNGKFKSWQLIAGESITSENGIMTLTPKGDAAAVLAQWDILVVPGRRYKISAEVRGKSAGQYRIYTEWRIPDPAKPNEKGRLSSYGGYWRSVGTEWKQETFFVTIPENARGAYMVIGARRTGFVQFRNVRIEEVEPEVIPQEASVGGGRWVLPAGAVFTMEKGKPVLTVTPVNGQKVAVRLTGIKVEAGKRYELSYSIQGRGQAGSDTGFHPFRFSVELPGIRNDGGPWDDTQNGIRHKKFEFTVPENFAGGNAVIVFETRTRGAIALWDFAFKELPPRPRPLITVDLTSPYFRDTLYAGSQESFIAGMIKVNAPKVKVTLSSAGRVISEKDEDVRNGECRFSIPAGSLAAGAYTLKISARVNGNDVTVERTITKLASAPSQVAWHPNGFFICNGQPFVPVICWTIAGTSADQSDAQIDRAFYYAARNGINSMIFRVDSGEAALRYLNIAQKYGMKLFFAVGNAPAADDNTLAIYENRIASLLLKEVKEHPALLGYFLVDEPYWRGIPSAALIESYKVLKFLDPHHPVWINAAPRGSVEVHAEYSLASDIYGVDVYPIPQPSSHSGLDDKTMSSIGKYVFRMDEACGGHKPIIMALQGFAWSEGKPDKTAVYPNFAELRFMTYDAITAGGTGASYWGTQGVLNADFYRNALYPVTRELQQISGILTALERAEVTSSDPAVRIYARKVDGKIYVIAANTSDKPVQVRISGFSAGSVSVVNENRNVSVNGGTLTDNFAAYGVHIYAEGALPAPSYGAVAENSGYEGQENPVFTHMREVSSRIPYRGNACWLWTEANARRPYSKVWVCKEFACTKTVQSAKLIIAADDTYQVWINGQAADVNFPKSMTYALADYIDVTSLIRTGGNVISIKGEDGGIVPCAVIADLVITYTDGSVEHIVTDGSWFASDKLVANWMTPAVFTQWPKAFVVAPYGSGAWGNNVKMKNPNFK